MARKKKEVVEEAPVEEVEADDASDDFVQLDSLTRVRRGVEDPDPKPKA